MKLRRSREHDPVEWFRGELLKNNILTDDEIAQESETARKKIAKVTMLAANSRDPSVKNIHFGVSIDTSSEHLDHDHKTKKLFKSPRKIPIWTMITKQKSCLNLQEKYHGTVKGRFSLGMLF
jgi:hypothetical protein